MVREKRSRASGYGSEGSDMTPEQNAAYVMAQSACALIEAMGMQADNQQHPQDQPYTGQDFAALIERYGIHHNAVITAMQT